MGVIQDAGTTLAASVICFRILHHKCAVMGTALVDTT